MIDDQPVQEGDLVSWRDSRYVVTSVSKWTVRLAGAHGFVRIRCLKPIADGGFSEATIVARCSVLVNAIIEPARA